MELPRGDAGYDRALERYETHKLAHPFGHFAGPLVDWLRGKEREHQVRLVMLEAAMALKLDGEAAFERVRDPEGGEAFERVPTKTGYELRSKLKLGTSHQRLRIGPEETVTGK